MRTHIIWTNLFKSAIYQACCIKANVKSVFTVNNVGAEYRNAGIQNKNISNFIIFVFNH